MSRMLSYEFYKLKKSKYWWICALVVSIMTFFSVYGLSVVRSLAPEESVKMLTLTAFKPVVIGQNSLMFSIVIGTLIGSDFSDGSIKNIASKSISRMEIVLSKIIIGFLIGMLLLTVQMITGLISGTLLIGFSNVSNNFWFDLLKLFGLSILQTMGFLGVFTLSGFILRTSGKSITANIIFSSFVPLLAELINQLAKLYFKSYDFSIFTLFPNSLSTLSGNNLGDNLTFCGIMLAYLIILGGVAIFTFEKRDIK